MLLLVAAALMTIAACSKDETDTPAQPVSSTPFDDIGASRALFSIGAEKQIRFSRGNLQYQASTDTWRFAEKQYESVGDGNGSVSPSYDGWIDCFCWGTSGWESGANAYEPWSISLDDADYQPGGNWQNGLFDDHANADWGVYNAISNGGNQPGMWRTLRNTEWAYLFGGGNRVSRWGRATIDGRYKGVVLLPDEWTTPDGIGFTPASKGFNSNVYTMEQWERLEAAGAVFLPASGFRQYIQFNYQNEYGAYWSVSPYNANAAVCCIFTSDMLYPSDGDNRSYALSVRLVQDK